MDAFQELTPVIYGKNGINFLHLSYGANEIPITAHWHNRIELLYMISGALDIYLNDVHTIARPEQTVIILPNTIHCATTSSTGAEYYVIAFDPQNFCNNTIVSDDYIHSLLHQQIAFSPVTDHPRITKVMKELTSLLSDTKKQHPLCSVSKIYELLGLFYQYCIVDASQIRKPDERFKDVLLYVNGHFTEDISSKTLSRQFGYDESYFCRRFKEATGTSPTKYIRYLRLEKAQHLLHTTSENICDIALRCGFSDICYFSNCFKRQFGTSPSVFRNPKK
ncbi:MAG: AraC family transcriptional regulator [Oliverpabstia sp.]|nr:AraC family transcriptional regulator [Oliverpabstia sp.]